MFQEPASTPIDIRFRLFRTAVRIHPLFWVIALLFGRNRFDDPDKSMAIWVFALFISILIHEFGHIIAMRNLDDDGYIVLHAFGGLAISTKRLHRTPKEMIQVALAGPIAGFILIVIIYVVTQLLGAELQGFYYGVTGWEIIEFAIPQFYVYDLGMLRLDEGVIPLATQAVIWTHINDLIVTLSVINILWGLLNLVPVFPLDGGQTVMGIFSLSNPQTGQVEALRVSLVVGAMISIVAVFVLQELYLGIMFGFLAFQSYQMLNSPY